LEIQLTHTVVGNPALEFVYVVLLHCYDVDHLFLPEMLTDLIKENPVLNAFAFRILADKFPEHLESYLVQAINYIPQSNVNFARLAEVLKTQNLEDVRQRLSLKVHSDVLEVLFACIHFANDNYPEANKCLSKVTEDGESHHLQLKIHDFHQECR
jgi:hypothetical protein